MRRASLLLNTSSPKHNVGRLLAISLATASLLGCDTPSRGDPAVQSEPAKVSAESITVSAEDVHVFEATDNIAVVRDLEVLPDGSVWVLNSVEPLFIGYDADGNKIAEHGTLGGGPEQLGLPTAFLTGGWNGQAWVFDFVRHGFFRASQPEGEGSRISMPEDQVPRLSVRRGRQLTDPTVRTERLGNEIVLARTTGSMADGFFEYRLALLGSDLIGVDPETGSARVIVALGEVLDDPSAGFIATNGGAPLWYRLWATCGNDHLRVFDRARNQLRGFDAEGQELEPIRLPPPPFDEVTPRQLAEAIFHILVVESTGSFSGRLDEADSARMVNEATREMKGEPHELAGYLPRYSDFRCSEEGTMWMRPLDPKAGGLKGGSTWLRVAPGGEIVEVTMPDRFDPLRFTQGRIWGGQRDEFDVASVAWVKTP